MTLNLPHVSCTPASTPLYCRGLSNDCQCYVPVTILVTLVLYTSNILQMMSFIIQLSKYIYYIHIYSYVYTYICIYVYLFFECILHIYILCNDPKNLRKPAILKRWADGLIQGRALEDIAEPGFILLDARSI